MKVKFYQNYNGRRPVADFLERLPADENARVTGCLENVEKLGFDSPRVIFRQIKGPLWEIKIKTHRGGYRFFYVCIKGINIVLLHAYKKQSQKAPRREIETAGKRMSEVFKNESAYVN